jgi:acetoin utilization protein AcuB
VKSPSEFSVISKGDNVMGVTKDLFVEKFMTKFPHTIGVDQPLVQAEKMMRQYGVHHLPVLDGGHLVGILSDRDIKLVETLPDVNPEEVKVEEAYTPDPIQVSPMSSLSEVSEKMLKNRAGSVLVTDHGKLVGIFTWMDALKALMEVARAQK